METYIAFLRGINVSGQRKIKMADLRLSLEQAGLEKVQTYIQSGNLVFQSAIAGIASLEKMITAQIAKDFRFEVPVLVTTPERIRKILEKDPFKNQGDLGSHYYALLKTRPDPLQIAAFDKLKFENEQFMITYPCVYLNYAKGYGKAKLNNNLIEKKLGVVATTRNLNTMKKMVALSELV